MLAFVRNDGASDKKFEFKTPKLELGGSQSIQPWEHLFTGVADYDGIVHALGLSETAPDKTVTHLKIEGTLYCNLKSKEQTWMILIFELPKATKDAKVIINDSDPAAIKIPMTSRQ